MQGKHMHISVLALACCIGSSRAAEPMPESIPPAEKKKDVKPTDEDQPKADRASTPAPINPTEVWRNLWADHTDYADRVDALYPVRPPWEAYPCHFYGEGGFFMVHTYLSHNPEVSITHGQGTSSATTTTTNFDYDVDFGPKVVLGVAGAGGWGLRGSWWLIDEESRTGGLTNRDATGHTVVRSTPAIGVPGFSSPGTVAKAFGVFNDNFGFLNHIRADDWILEASKEFQGDLWSLLVTGGARYTYISQGYFASRVNSGTGSLGTSKVTLIQDSDNIAAGHNFGGIGPTVSLDFHRQIAQTCFALYGTARGSVLFGDETMTAFQLTVENAKITPKKGPVTVINSSTLVSGRSTGEATVPMGDFEVGVNWSKNAGRARLYLQAGIVDETWWNTGSATTPHGLLGFFGLQIMAGVNY
jgi:hypothetical protein